jgi:hypothetical protein
MHIPKLFFIIDVESVGLHGDAFAVGGGVFMPNGSALWEFRYACPINECEGVESDRQWVKDNCPPIEATYQIPRSLRDAFWAVWQKAKSEGATMAADCLWPVEGRFVAKCIDDDPESRRWEGPYPFMEISSVLMASGMDPLGQYDRSESEPKHDPLGDARQSARMLANALSKLGCLQ